jgi:phosphoglycolate phosphatase
MNTNLKLLVFDWDGTLMDSQARILNCMRAAIREMGAATRSDEEILNIIGLGLAEAIQTLYPEQNRAFVNVIAESYREHFLELDQTPSALFDKVREVLQGLRESGYLLAVATGKARQGLEKGFETTQLQELFHSSRCADETTSKPHPHMLQEIITDLGMSPAETLMIGDTEYDMQMSNHAGTHALAVSYGVHALPRLMRHNPLGYIDAIAELPQWLEDHLKTK